MLALKQRRAEKARQEWYAARGQKPPTLEPPSTPRHRFTPVTQTLTTTCVLENFNEKRDPEYIDMTYWEGEGAGIEPLEFLASINALKSDVVISRTKYPFTKNGKINKCYTPYENDIMSFEAFETARNELKRRAQHLADEMERVDKEFNRDPVPDWFMLPKKGRKDKFTIEHCRFLEKQRRRAAKRKYKDYYEAQERAYHQEE